MRIEVFSPEKKGADELERKILESDVIMHADVAAYADQLVRVVQAMDIAKKDEAVVITALSHDNIMGLVAAEPEFAELTEDEIRSVVDRIRVALIGELKGKLEGDVYLEKTTIKKKKASAELLNDIKVVIPLSGAERIYKNQESVTDEYDEEEFRRAFARFSQLPPHPNISRVMATDETTRKNIVEKLELRTLAEYLDEGGDGRENLVTSLAAVRDCMRGGEYLSEHGFVMQDIHPNNIGLARGEGGEKGVLFDLEGIVDRDAPLANALAHGIRYLYPAPSAPEAMTYQFGLCLQTILDGFWHSRAMKPEIKEKLEGLVEKMSHPSSTENYLKDPPEISLEMAREAVDALIAQA